jgi:hypothetical protein
VIYKMISRLIHGNAVKRVINLKTTITSTNLIYDSKSTTTNDIAVREISSSVPQTRQSNTRHGRSRSMRNNTIVRSCKYTHHTVDIISINS